MFKDLDQEYLTEEAMMSTYTQLAHYALHNLHVQIVDNIQTIAPAPVSTKEKQNGEIGNGKRKDDGVEGEGVVMDPVQAAIQGKVMSAFKAHALSKKVVEGKRVLLAEVTLISLSCFLI